MQYKIGELVRSSNVWGDDVWIVHRAEDQIFSGFIGLTNVRTGERHQVNVSYIRKIKTDKK